MHTHIHTYIHAYTFIHAHNIQKYFNQINEQKITPKSFNSLAWLQYQWWHTDLWSWVSLWSHILWYRCTWKITDLKTRWHVHLFFTNWIYLYIQSLWCPQILQIALVHLHRWWAHITYWRDNDDGTKATEVKSRARSHIFDSQKQQQLLRSAQVASIPNTQQCDK